MISLSSITSQSYLLINAELDKLLLSYGLIILSFMAGTHWGFAAKSSGVLSTKAYLSSVIPTFLILGISKFEPQGIFTSKSLAKS